MYLIYLILNITYHAAFMEFLNYLALISQGIVTSQIVNK